MQWSANTAAISSGFILAGAAGHLAKAAPALTFPEEEPDHMGQWEYRTVPLVIEKGKYTVTFVSRRKISGLQAILEESDTHGWEFVQIVDAFYPGRYTAIFRRPRANQQWQQGRISGPFGVPEE